MTYFDNTLNQGMYSGLDSSWFLFSIKTLMNHPSYGLTNRPVSVGIVTSLFGSSAGYQQSSWKGSPAFFPRLKHTPAKRWHGTSRKHIESSWSYRQKKHVSFNYVVLMFGSQPWHYVHILPGVSRLEEFWWSCHVVMRTYDATYVTYVCTA